MGRKISRKEFVTLSAASLAACAFGEIPLWAADKKKAFPVFPSGERIGLVNCSLLDVTSGKTERNVRIVIRNGLIESVDRAPEKGAPVRVTLDLGGRTVSPGFIDAHCHSTIQSCAKLSAFDLSKYLAQLRRNYTMQADAGVTTIRDMGCLPLLIKKYSAEISKGKLPGPRILFANAIANLMGGHPEILPSDFSVFGNLTAAVTGNMAMNYVSTDDLKKKLRWNLDHGASLIKLTMDNRSLLCGRGAIPSYPDGDLAYLFDTAAATDRPVSAHILMKNGFLRAIDYPMHSMEHVVSDIRLTDAEISAMAKKKIAIVPTAIIGQMSAFPEAFDVLPAEYRTDFIENEIKIKNEYLSSDLVKPYDPHLHRLNIESIQWLKKPGCHCMSYEKKFMTKPSLGYDCMLYGYDNLRRMKDAGILIGTGTDAGVTFLYHGTIWREIEILTRIGFTNAEALRAATVNGAKILRLADRIGTVEAGKSADLAVLGGDPLVKIEHCRRPALVLREGKIISLSGRLAPDGPGERASSYRLES